VLGALEAVTKDTVVVANDSYINADSVGELLLVLAARHPEPAMPVTLILDNARYQKCEAVRELAEILDIELVYLPTYSPNLNLIERLWKFMKKKCLYSKYYESFDKFKEAITECLDKLGTVYKEELESLLSLKFQTFSNSQIKAA
jgi:transposase